MADEVNPGRLRRVVSAAVAEWREIGGLGRLALIGVVASGAVAISLGFSITASARTHLLDARSEIIEGIIDDLAHPYPDLADPVEFADFDVDVRERLVGGETVRVKVWQPDGSIVYSDDTTLIGDEFELAEPALTAFTGEPASKVSDLSEPAHAAHRSLGSLIEFYIPFGQANGEVTSVFEVEQRTDRLEAALAHIERNVWLSIGAGLSVLGLFLGALAMARASDLNKRRREAEQVLGASLHAQEEERVRIVGALHDDVGQPLYRLLYGLDGTRARLPEGDPLRDELEDLSGLVSQIDRTLRAELRILHQGVLADIGLEDALEDLAETVRKETGLNIETSIDMGEEPEDVPRRAIFRTATEALTNVRKHSEATEAKLEVATGRGEVVLTVSDDGNGRPVRPGLGLTTTRERLEAIGGSLEVRSRPGRGTTIRARVPSRIGEAL